MLRAAAVITILALPTAACAAPTPAPAPATEVAHPTSEPPDTTRPPQFVVVSFDGAGDADLWRYWRAVGRRDHAHFTFFLSGVYLLSRAGASFYHPPGRPVGSSAIGFVEAPPGTTDRAYIGQLLEQIAEGRAEEQELGTHFNGHFCGPRGVASWTAADWGTELDAFDSLLEGALDHNGLGPGDAAPPPPASTVVGERTPCLEGDLSALYPVLRARGLRYDASRSAPRGDWPVREQGIWSLPLGIVERAGTSQRNVAMDYSFYVNQSGAVDAPAAATPALEEQTYQSYLGAFRASYLGDRAPLNIGHHFTTWNHGAYLRALTRLLDGVCRVPEVRCVALAELADWLDVQPPGRLAAAARGDFPHPAEVLLRRPIPRARADPRPAPGDGCHAGVRTGVTTAQSGWLCGDRSRRERCMMVPWMPRRHAGGSRSGCSPSSPRCSRPGRSRRPAPGSTTPPGCSVRPTAPRSSARPPPWPRPGRRWW